MHLTHAQFRAAALAAADRGVDPLALATEGEAPGQTRFALDSAYAKRLLSVPEDQRADRLSWSKQTIPVEKLDQVMVRWAPPKGKEVVYPSPEGEAELAQAEAQWGILLSLGLIGGKDAKPSE